ncbi:MAG: NAD(P)/FAD-dependent oxidoreductase [Clostridiales bacterium]|nr:NAD(P)/FAD-dependent oxidoreductase [Clostridiales bacterium]
MNQFPLLSAPGKLGNLELKNHIIMSPMSVNYDRDDQVLPRHIRYIEERARGGAAMIVTGGMTVDTDLCGRNEVRQLHILAPTTRPGIQALINAAHKYDAKIMFQFEHMGRNAAAASNQGQAPVAPSPIQDPFPGSEMPRELTKAEIHQLVDKYIAGAKLCYELGADGIELHGGHSHLLGQFADPRRNQRTDEYGGNFENRMRFITEIIRGIQSVKPKNCILSVRINGTDALPDGLTVEEGTEIAVYLESLGIDALSLTYSNMANIDRTMEPAFYDEGCRSYFVKPIKEHLHIPVISVNNIKRAETAERILEDGICDFIGLGRALLADPQFPDKAFTGRADCIRGCIGCMTCLDSVNSETALVCAMNPLTGREYLYNEDTLKKDGDGKLVLVIGGGPAGIEAGIILARRGFRVRLFDKNPILGGSLVLASKGKGKDKITWALQGMIHELTETGTEINLEHECTAEEILNMQPYAVVLATGASPVKPGIPGLDRSNVYLAHDILRNDISFKNKRIAIIGSGMTGLETAEVLLSGGNRIVMYDLLDEIAKGAIFTVRGVVMDYLSQNGVEFYPSHKLIHVTDAGVALENILTGETVTDPADIIVLSLGVRPDRTLESQLEGKLTNLISIGDCGTSGGKVFQATRDALFAAWDL